MTRAALSPGAEVARGREMRWSDEQRAVIEADFLGYLLVEAPPGCGKTEVARARVAWLINQGAEPTNILLLSFTRTAVAEMRDRIRALAQSEQAAAAVRITTLDSAVWRLRYGFSEDEVTALFGSYDANIQDVTEMLRDGHDGLIEHLQRLEHVIIDEAQDLTGVRATFVRELIRVLPEECGVTIFADRGQAIYGFTNDEKDIARDGSEFSGYLLELLDRDPPEDLNSAELSQVFRTDSRQLLELFLDTRQDLLNPAVPGRDRYDRVRARIETSCGGNAGRIGEDDSIGLEGRDDTLVLYRRRAEVLLASSFLSTAGIPHRIRMSGMPVCLEPWIAAVLGPIRGGVIDRAGFERSWADCPHPRVLDACDMDEAWARLERIAGTGRRRLDWKRLRQMLSRSQPPAELCAAELGHSGPILGTIHASKGREAPRVVLMLPIPPSGVGNSSDLDEESRVLYVGATRAQHELLLGQGYRLTSRSLEESGRSYRLFRDRDKPRAQVEMGRAGDLEEVSVTSRSLHRTAEQAGELQRLLASLHGHEHAIRAETCREWGWRYRLFIEDDDVAGFPLGQLSESVSQDLWSAGRILKAATRGPDLKPPTRIAYLQLVAVRSVVLGEDDPRLDRLHPPYRESGIFLAPVFKAFTMIYYRRWWRRV